VSAKMAPAVGYDVSMHLAVEMQVSPTLYCLSAAFVVSAKIAPAVGDGTTMHLAVEMQVWPAVHEF